MVAIVADCSRLPRCADLPSVIGHHGGTVCRTSGGWFFRNESRPIIRLFDLLSAQGQGSSLGAEAIRVGKECTTSSPHASSRRCCFRVRSVIIGT